MPSYALVTGNLFKTPETRTSKSGKPFVTATIKTQDGLATQWWQVAAFSEPAQAELMRLRDGEALSVQGPIKIEAYEKAGERKTSLSIVADSVLALRQPKRAKVGD